MKWPLLFTLVFNSMAAAGQAGIKTGILTGQVYDENREPLPFVNISIHDSSMYIVAGGTTNFDGLFKIKSLLPNQYELRASSIKYKMLIIKDIPIEPSYVTTLPPVHLNRNKPDTLRIPVIQLDGDGLPPLVKMVDSLYIRPMSNRDLVNQLNNFQNRKQSAAPDSVNIDGVWIYRSNKKQ